MAFALTPVEVALAQSFGCRAPCCPAVAVKADERARHVDEEDDRLIAGAFPAIAIAVRLEHIAARTGNDIAVQAAGT